MKGLVYKLLGVIILIAFGLLIYYNPSIYNPKYNKEEEKLYDEDIMINEIIKAIKTDEEKFDKMLKKTQLDPKKIIDFNAKVIIATYETSDEGKIVLSDEDILLLGGIQRKYYSEELLQENDEKSFNEKLLSSVRSANKAGNFFIGYESKEVFVSNEDKEAVIDVAYIPNSVGEFSEIYQRYLLKKVANRWYIVGWDGIDKEEYSREK